MKKTGIWQVQSDVALSSEANLARLQTALSELESKDNVVRPANSLQSLGSQMSYHVMLSSSAAGHACWIKARDLMLTFRHPFTHTQVVYVVVVLSGRLTLWDGTETQTLETGTVLMTDHVRALTYRPKSEVELAVLIVKADYFMTHTGWPAMYFLGQTFSPDALEVRLFARLVQTAMRHIAMMTPDVMASASDGMFCFLRPILASAMRARAQEKGRAGAMGDRFTVTPDERRREATAWIQAHLTQTNLTNADIAHGVGLSERYLLKLFNAVGTTPMATVYDLRLQRAAVQLKEPHMAQASVAEIATANGFKRPEHFARRFKAKYGITPLAWRRRESKAHGTPPKMNQ